MSASSVNFDMSPREIAEEILERITRPEECYSSTSIGAELIAAASVLRDNEVDNIGHSLKFKFQKDFSAARNGRWWGEIRAFREDARQAQRRESPYLMTNTGTYLANLANAKTMMGSLAITFNSFTYRCWLTRPAPWGTEGAWTDHDDTMAAEWCQRQGLNIDVHIAAQAAESIARSRTPYYHPVVEYLSSLEWDGIPRCDRWLSACLAAPQNQSTAEIGVKWLIAAVKRVFEPGCQSDYTLVLEGEQGKYKSSALRVLAGDEWFTDDVGDIHDEKKAAEKLRGKWIVEIAELDAFRKADMTTVKSWLTRRTDRFRGAYERRASDQDRHCIFAATTNRDDWGQDETGLRRFWPIRTGEVAIEKLREHRDQIWAEAVHRYRAGESSWLDGDSEVAVREEQDLRQDSDAWDDSVAEWCENPGGSPSLKSSSRRVLIPEILQYCLGIPQKDWNHSHRLRVGRILKVHCRYRKRRALRSEADDSGKRIEFWEPKPGA
jgi:putative DNA primase/helicase